MISEQKLWDLVNSCDGAKSSRIAEVEKIIKLLRWCKSSRIAEVEKIILESDVDNDVFDELMMALTYLSREARRTHR